MNQKTEKNAEQCNIYCFWSKILPVEWEENFSELSLSEWHMNIELTAFLGKTLEMV